MAEVMVTLKNVSKKYGNVKALDKVSLSLERGKIYGLIGKNGAGKTTLMRVIAGLAFASAGDVEVHTKQCGILIEEPSLNTNMTAKQNLKFCRMLLEGGTQNKKLFGGKKEMPGKESGSEKSQDLTDDQILEMVGLENTGKKRVKNFSLGMRQRLGIAVALLGNPDFVMLDEPVNGLDPIGVIEIRKLMHKLNEEYDMTILISSHNLPELYQTASDFIIMDKGNIIKEISQETLEKETNGNLEEAYYETII